MEFFSCCLAALGLPVLGVIFLAARHRRRQAVPDAHLSRLMQDFVLGYGRSRENVEQIHVLLMTEFANEPAYEQVTVAAASFVPGGTPPFLDEQGLAEAFRVFLQRQYRIRIDTPVDDGSVWPPSPRARDRRSDGGRAGLRTTWGRQGAAD